MDEGDVFDPTYENINAPQFFDFTKSEEDDDDPEDYFNYDHANGGQPIAAAFEAFDNSGMDASMTEEDGKPEEDKVEDMDCHEMTPVNKNKVTPCKSVRTTRKTRSTPMASESPECSPCSNFATPATSQKGNRSNNYASPELNAPNRKDSYSPPEDMDTNENNETENRRNTYNTPVQNTPRLRRDTYSTPTAEETNEVQQKEEDNVTKNKEKILPNLCTSLSEWNKHKKNTSVTSNPESNNVGRKMTRSLTRENQAVATRTRSRSVGSPSLAKLKAHKKRSLSKTRHPSGKQNTSVSSTGSTTHTTKAVPQIKARLTIPVTPSFMKRTHVPVIASSSDTKSTEEMELERIRKLKQEVAARKKMAVESYKKTKAIKAYAPARSAQPLTQPVEFDFATNKRVHEPQEKPELKRTRSFSSGLRSKADPKPLPNKTIPQPFNLHQDKKKRSLDHEQGKKFTSMAERVIAYAKRTPDRFHTRSKKEQVPTCTEKKECKLTVPKTPQFSAGSRKRNHQVESQADKEEKELEEIKKYKFTAHPVNDKIFKQPSLGVKKPAPKEPTKPVEFDFESNRIKPKPAKPEEQFEFHARPAPKAILAGTVGIKPIKKIPLTVPESPRFELRNRLKTSMRMEEEEIPVEPVRAKPVPHFGLPYQPKFDHKVTEIQAFSFDERDKKMLANKEKKITKQLEEEKIPTFTANPLPSDSPDILPRVNTKAPTIPEPFHLESDIRGAVKAEEWSQRMEEELKQQRIQTTFKAHPAKVTHMSPFVPTKSTKPLTEILDVELNTERQAEKRHEFEVFKKEREIEIMESRRAQEIAKEEEEKREIAMMRKNAVHKANPVKKYKGVEIKASDKSLTEPKTPNFSERLYRNQRV